MAATLTQPPAEVDYELVDRIVDAVHDWAGRSVYRVTAGESSLAAIGHALRTQERNPSVHRCAGCREGE